jgi:plastocyanin
MNVIGVCVRTRSRLMSYRMQAGRFVRTGTLFAAAALALAACSGAATSAPTIGPSVGASASAAPSAASSASASAAGGGGYGASASAGASAASSGGAASGSDVKVIDFGFNPSSITVKTGTSVTWTNTGSATHTVTADDASFDSGDLSSGATFSQTFAKAGTYTYHCKIHATMKGTVVVTP